MLILFNSSSRRGCRIGVETSFFSLSKRQDETASWVNERGARNRLPAVTTLSHVSCAGADTLVCSIMTEDDSEFISPENRHALRTDRAIGPPSAISPDKPKLSEKISTRHQFSLCCCGNQQIPETKIYAIPSSHLTLRDDETTYQYECGHGVDLRGTKLLTTSEKYPELLPLI